MRTNEKGQFIKFLVTDRGVTTITEDHVDFNNPAEMAVCASFEEVALFAIEAMSQRIIQLELKLGAKNE